MNPKQIKIGATYRNKGAGTTERTVIAIGREYRPERWWGNANTSAPNEPGVLFKQGTMEHKLYLSSFASWAGSVVENKV